MKNNITIVAIFILTIVNAQTYNTTKPLENRGGVEEGVYYKDINNILDGFEGIYEYNGPDFYFKIKLEKKELINNNNYWWTDTLKGTYQYIINGVEVNYLSDVLNTNDVTRIEADWIKQANDTGLPYFCPECLNEKWLVGYISDEVNDRIANLFIAKRVVNGEVGLQLGFYYEVPRKSQNAAHLPEGEFFVKKIN